VFRQDSVHDMFVDIDPERVRDDAGYPRTAEPRIARLELDDGLNERIARPFRSGFFGHGLDEKSRRYLRRTNA
jgi:hypothetical protein